LMELGVPPYLLSATLLGVLAQRLIRTLCPNCKQPMDDKEKADSQATLNDIIKPWSINGGYRPYKSVGCVDCRMTGYMGRMGIYELLTVSESFKALVYKEGDMNASRKQGITDGMRPLRLAAALRVADGATTLAELLASTPLMA
jgi:general secretion pathway protein E